MIKINPPTAFYERKLSNILIGILLFYLMTSFVHKISNFFFRENIILPITASIKIGFLFFLTCILIFNYSKNKKLLIYLVSLLFVFILSKFNWSFYQKLNINFYDFLDKENLFYFIKYLYPFVFLGVFLLVENKNRTIDLYFRILEGILVFNAFFVLIGFLFSIDFFQSYPHTSRFGYSGFLERLYFAYFSIIVIARKFFSNKIDYRLLALCIAILLSGMKVIFLFLLLLSLFYLYEKSKTKILFFVSILIFLGILFLKPIINVLIKIFPFWQPILDKHGYLTVIFSTRDLALKNTIEYMKSYGSVYDFLIGNVGFPKYYTEMDFIDLYLFFGIIGLGIYVLLMSKIIKKHYHLIPLIVSFLAGGFLCGTILVFTYFLWMYETHKTNINCFEF